MSSVYAGTSSDTPSIFEVGATTDVAYTSLWLQGNYDTVHAAVVWSTTITERTLPASLYRASKPGWWPSGDAWPWVGPDLSPMVGTLPAKARSDTQGH